MAGAAIWGRSVPGVSRTSVAIGTGGACARGEAVSPGALFLGGAALSALF
jgi:hypothetical protein